jgi:ankyrin repeat protein
VRVLLDAGWPASGEALHAAVEKAALASARLLVERGARIDALDSAGNPVLSVAIQLQGREVPDTSAGPGVTVWNSERPRVAAAPSAEIDAFVRFLLARGAKVDLTARQKGTRPLCAAAEVGRGDWVELLLERGAAIEPPFGHLATTPLLEAVMHGHAELIPMLIARGADLHRRSPDGDGVVWRACCINQNTLRTLPLLLERGANPNHGDGNRTPLDILQYSTHADAAAIIALLRQYGGKSGDELAASKPVDSAVAAQAEPLPDFSGKTSKRFRERAAKLAKPHGFAWQEAADIRGTLIVSVATTIADQVMEPAAIAKRLEEGLLVMAEGSRAVRGDTTVLRAIPSKDWADALRCAQTNGCNYDLMPDDIIRWLRRLEREQPFTITAVAHDVVEGRFEGPIADPKALAKRMYRFCPDLVDQGCGTVEALAKTLVGENPQLYFWWD